MSWLIVAFIVWYLIGFCSFVYWWTNDYDFTLVDFFIALLAGTMGVIAFVIGAYIHGDAEEIIIFKQRKKK